MLGSFTVSKVSIENIIASIEFKSTITLLLRTNPFQTFLKTNIREAIEFVRISWNHVSTETITHAWQKTGIIPNNMAVENEEDVVSSTNTELIELVNRS